MKIFNKIKNTGWGLLSALLILSACNKLELDPVPLTQPIQETSPTIGTLLDNPDFSFLKAAVQRAGLAAAPGTPTLLQQLSNPAQRFTVFAPDNNAFIASGIPSIAVINSLPVPSVFGLVSYHVVPQVIKAASIPDTFPNFQYPSILNPRPDISPLLRLTTFPSVRSNGAWVNNIPIIATDIIAVNGVIHKVALLVAPPSTSLWSRINSDADLTYLKAAIQRADSGTTATVGILNMNNLQSVLTEFGPNLTVFAPGNAAFQAVLYAAGYPIVYKQLYDGAYAQAIGLGLDTTQAKGIATNYATANAGSTTTALISSPTIFQNPDLYSSLTAQRVKGIIVYHLLGSRAFAVNLPTTIPFTNVPTLLNSAIPTHLGVGLFATFTGPFVSSATVKGLINSTPANIAINPSPNPNGTSDQHFINGVLHKIDQVLLPLPL